MNIFESLENLNVSEECFDEIMGLVEELLNEDNIEKYIVKRGGKSAKRIENGKTIYTVDATNPDRDQPKSKELDHIEHDIAHDIKPSKKAYNNALKDQKRKERASIYKSIDRNLQKNSPSTPAYNLRPSDEQHKQVEAYMKKNK